MSYPRLVTQVDCYYLYACKDERKGQLMNRVMQREKATLRGTVSSNLEM